MTTMESEASASTGTANGDDEKSAAPRFGGSAYRKKKPSSTTITTTGTAFTGTLDSSSSSSPSFRTRPSVRKQKQLSLSSGPAVADEEAASVSTTPTQNPKQSHPTDDDDDDNPRRLRTPISVDDDDDDDINNSPSGKTSHWNNDNNNNIETTDSSLGAMLSPLSSPMSSSSAAVTSSSPSWVVGANSGQKQHQPQQYSSEEELENGMLLTPKKEQDPSIDGAAAPSTTIRPLVYPNSPTPPPLSSEQLREWMSPSTTTTTTMAEDATAVPRHATAAILEPPPDDDTVVTPSVLLSVSEEEEEMDKTENDAKKEKTINEEDGVASMENKSDTTAVVSRTAEQVKQEKLEKVMALLASRSSADEDDDDEAERVNPFSVGLPRSPFLPPINNDDEDDTLVSETNNNQTNGIANKKNSVSTTTTTPMKSALLSGGQMYQSMSEMAPVLSLVEAKRKEWFRRELVANRREWNHYRTWLRTTVQEISKVECMISSSHAAFVGYSSALADIANDVFVDDSGEKIPLHAKEKQRRQKKNLAKSPMLDAMTESFLLLKEDLDMYLSSLNESLIDATSLKYDITAKANEIEAKGVALGFASVERAEAFIQDAFQTLITAAAEWSDQTTDDPDDSTANNNGNDDDADNTESTEIETLRDRWLLETNYRNAAKLGLLTWKENRRDYQSLYAEIMQVDQDRKASLKEILLSFLPRRKKLLDCARGALMLGSDALEVSKASKQNESDAIERVLEELMASSNLQDVKLDVSSRGEPVSVVTAAAAAAAANAAPTNDIWNSHYVKERRVVAVKMNKEWKVGVCVTTLDDHAHIFSTNEDDTSVDSAESENSTTLTFDAVVQRLSIPIVPAYSIKLAEFGISVPKGAATNAGTKTTTMEIDFVRRARSKIFRKRDDQIVLRLLDTSVAAPEWVVVLTTATRSAPVADKMQGAAGLSVRPPSKGADASKPTTNAAAHKTSTIASSPTIMTEI